jgi:hypothetical protein
MNGLGDYVTPSQDYLSPSDPTPGSITSMGSPLGASKAEQYWGEFTGNWRNIALAGSAVVVLFLLWRLSKKG